MARVLIIGGGVSGLSAGIYAQLYGHQAIVCERSESVGGNLIGWQRNEYHIDNCIHWLTGTNPHSDTYKMWEELGALGDVEIMQGDSLYTCEYGGKRLSLKKDLNELKQDMLLISPQDKNEILSFIKAIEALQYICNIGGKDHSEGFGAWGYISSFPLLLKYHRMSTKELAGCFKSEMIRQFILCFLGDDFASSALLFVFAHFTALNGGIPRGSSYEMAQRMKNRLVSLGGEILTKKEAIKINCENGIAHSVLFKDGTVAEADYIVLTPDPKMIFEKIIDLKMPRQLKQAYDNRRLFRFSSYHCAFSCNCNDIDFTGDFIFEIPENAQRKLHTKYLILREFSHESSFAPKGKCVLQSLTFCNEHIAKEFIELRKNTNAYRAKKQELASLIKELIIARFPKLESSLTLIDMWTPATYHRYVNSEIGSFMSFAMVPKQSLSRMSNKIKGLKNVFLATQWQQAPGGLPIAAQGGKLAIEAIVKAEARQEKHNSKKPVPIKAFN